MHEERDGGTRWHFTPVHTVQTRCGTGLCAARAFAQGEVVLADRWLVGVLLEAGRSRRNACEHCLRVCAWSPVDHSCPGCKARYCSAECRDSAWNLHHRLLCTAVPPPTLASATHPLDVFVKHARLAPTVLQQKHEEVLLAAKMLAACTLWDDEASAAATGAATAAAAAAAGAGASSGAVPPPFDRLCSYCVVGAARKDGKPTEAFAARSKFVGDSYRLLAASALGAHPRFAARCPPAVYSHCLGMIDANAACACAVSASLLHAARAGSPQPGTSPTSREAGTAEGVGIYALFSFANHACAPSTLNAKGPDDGDACLDNRLLLRAVRDIAAGEEVTFDYLDDAYERGQGVGVGVGVGVGGGGGVPSRAPSSDEERRARLREHFGFECKCDLCVQT